MSDNIQNQASVKDYYNAVADNYFQQYQQDNLQSGRKYPQNYYRMQWLAQKLATLGAKSVFEVGVGEGTPLATLAQMGMSVAGCDISEKMVEHTRAKFTEMGIDPSRVQWADVQDSLSMVKQVGTGPFDALFAFGVMPHVEKDNVALNNMKMFVKKGGRVFIEFRNSLFSLFTMNRYTKEFILDELLAGVADDVKAVVEQDLDKRLAVDLPKKRMTDGVSYDEIRAKFHNPFEILEMFEREGFKNPQLFWYHFHAGMPMLEGDMKKRFWEEASRMELNGTASWRGYFLCSAFVVEAEVA